MICKLCGDTRMLKVRQVNKPDKYEMYVGISAPVCRSWYRCLSCGLYNQLHRTYPLDELMPIYTNGYRDEDFRDETLDETFRKIRDLPPQESENRYRVRWLLQRIHGKHSLLDIGSGFGIFPYTMKWHGFDVTCLEPNKASAAFINGKLKMICHNAFFEDAVKWLPKCKVVSAIHVLEHTKDPEGFLKDIGHVMQPEGLLFLEVPDAEEFSTLPEDHDEFNSTHLYFFDVSTLFRLVEYAGFRVRDIHRVHHKTRDLKRILLVGDKC